MNIASVIEGLALTQIKEFRFNIDQDSGVESFLFLGDNAMGYYTALYGKVELKPEIANDLYTTGDDIPEWKRLRQCRGLTPHPDIQVFLNDPRRDFIARGDSAYFDYNDTLALGWDTMLKEVKRKGWKPQPDVLIDDINTNAMRHYDPNTHTLTFFCSLKNYTGTIAAFLKILPLIADDWYLWTEGEDDADDNLPPNIAAPYDMDTCTYGKSVKVGFTGAESSSGGTTVNFLPVSVKLSKNGPVRLGALLTHNNVEWEL